MLAVSAPKRVLSLSIGGLAAQCDCRLNFTLSVLRLEK